MKENAAKFANMWQNCKENAENLQLYMHQRSRKKAANLQQRSSNLATNLQQRRGK
jgi:hypothetical protein